MTILGFYLEVPRSQATVQRMRAARPRVSNEQEKANLAHLQRIHQYRTISQTKCSSWHSLLVRLLNSASDPVRVITADLNNTIRFIMRLRAA